MFLFQFCFSGDTQKKNKSWEESNTLNTEHMEHMLATVERKHCTDVLWEQDPPSR